MLRIMPLLLDMVDQTTKNIAMDVNFFFIMMWHRIQLLVPTSEDQNRTNLQNKWQVADQCAGHRNKICLIKETGAPLVTGIETTTFY